MSKVKQLNSSKVWSIYITWICFWVSLKT